MRAFSALPRLRSTSARRLIIVPDGVLQRLPFALLRSNNRWLVETHTLALAPSATILQFLRQSRPARAPEPLLALAVPDPPSGQAAIFDGGVRTLGVLTHAADEVGYARRLLGATSESARTGAAASEEALKSPDASRYRILHLAAHAIADEIVPRRSAVLLTPGGQEDGLLQVSEIANLSLNADLVVLAACRSHVGRLVRGEGLLSLSRAFMHAGARAVVATAWSVADRETAWLMRRFYSRSAGRARPRRSTERAVSAMHSQAGVRRRPRNLGRVRDLRRGADADPRLQRVGCAADRRHRRRRGDPAVRPRRRPLARQAIACQVTAREIVRSVRSPRHLHRGVQLTSAATGPIESARAPRHWADTATRSRRAR